MRRQRTGWAKRNARADVRRFDFPLGSRASSDVRSFDYFGIVTPARGDVTRKLPIASGCVLLRVTRTITFRHCENFVSREHVCRTCPWCASEVCREQRSRITTSGYPGVTGARVFAEVWVACAMTMSRGFCGSVTGASL